MDTRDIVTPIYYYLLGTDSKPIFMRYEDGPIALLLFTSRDRAEEILGLCGEALRPVTISAREAPQRVKQMCGFAVLRYILDLEAEQLDEFGRTTEDHATMLWPLTVESLQGVVT